MTIEPTDWIATARAAVAAAQVYTRTALEQSVKLVAPDGRLDSAAADREQRGLHGFAWICTTVEAMVATAEWAARAYAASRFTELEELTLRIGLGEYLAQLLGGVAMSQNEYVRPHEMRLTHAAQILAADPAVGALLDGGNTAPNRLALAQRLSGGELPDESLDETLDIVRAQFRDFVREQIAPHAHAWHIADALIPDDVIAKMAELGVFGICIDAAHGGLGLGKLAMSLVSEELSRGWICAGSLGTRSEIAGELIGANGTPEQKAKWLPGLASGSILPTAVFTEPDTGSDLAAVRTRAIRLPEGEWKITGSKTWITHAARADLMTVLCRTEPDTSGYSGLSMLLVGKTRRTEDADFPDHGLDGTEIPVLGYRGMREYVLTFDGLPADAGALLGDSAGQGFKQLMQTFEGARIQTAARAIGVGWSAFDVALRYAGERKQFGQPLNAFPRVSDKLALMATELVMARELTYAAARKKDLRERCDVEAGMAKLLAARVAWANADLCVQIHGGNGYALEYEASRILCDARILSIFEGAAEIQAHVIGRGLVARAIGSNPMRQ